MNEAKFGIRAFSDRGDAVTIYQCGHLMPTAPRGTRPVTTPRKGDNHYETRDGAALTAQESLPNGKRAWLNESTGERFVER